MLQHAAECRTMRQHIDKSAQTKILIPPFSNSAVKNRGALVGGCSGSHFKDTGSIPSDVSTMSFVAAKARSRAGGSPPPLFSLSLGAVL